MNHRFERWLSMMAVLLVLFTAMLDPRISAALSIILLVALILYSFFYKSETEDY